MPFNGHIWSNCYSTAKRNMILYRALQEASESFSSKETAPACPSLPRFMAHQVLIHVRLWAQLSKLACHPETHIPPLGLAPWLRLSSKVDVGTIQGVLDRKSVV